MADECLKRCAKCGIEKPHGRYWKNRTKPDGLNTKCIDCYRLYQRPDPERAKQRQREAWQRWRKRHPDAQRQRQRNNSRRDYRRRWKARNPHKGRVYLARKRTRQAGASGDFTVDEWMALCQRYDMRCLACKQVKPLTVDHVLPLSQGGTNDIGNIQPLCGSCNSHKHSKHIDYR